MDECITNQVTKRTMTPAIADMTVKEERMCLSEIRSRAPGIKHDYILRNNMTAGAFSLKYVMGHHIKRKTKNKVQIIETIENDETIETEISNKISEEIKQK